MRAGPADIGAGLPLPGSRSQKSTDEDLWGRRGVFPASSRGLRRVPLPMHPPAPLPVPLLRPADRSRPNEEVWSGGVKQQSAMSAAGLSDSDSGGRPDSCQTVPAYPLPPFRKRPATSKGTPAPSLPPYPSPVRLGPRDRGSPEGVKKFAQLGHWARRGRGACPDSRGRSRLPGARLAECASGRGRVERRVSGERSAPKPSSAPRGLASNGAFPERPRRGPGDPPGAKDAVPRTGPAAFAPARAGRRLRGGQEPHVGPLAPDAARPVAARLLGAGPAGGARSPEPGSAPGNKRCFSREVFLERSGNYGMGRAPEAGAAGGQPRSAFGTLLRNRGDMRASPHPALLLASFPPRPLRAGPFRAGRRLRGGAWRDESASRVVSPTPARFWS